MAMWLLGANNMALGNLIELFIILEQFSSIPIRVGWQNTWIKEGRQIVSGFEVW
jgi:hypothetical protein